MGDDGDDGSQEPPPSPVANGDSLVVPEDGSVTLNQLLLNDDVDGALIVVVAQPQHGTISSSQFETQPKYTPDPGFFGTDSFTYAARDVHGHDSNVVTVNVNVTSDGIPYERSQQISTQSLGDVVAGDIDGDGKLDLVGVNSASQMVVLRNVGTGTGDFRAEPYVFEGGLSARALVVTDIDRDGRLDVLTASGDGISVFKNIAQPGAPFAFAAPEYLGHTPMNAAALTDLNADGIDDVVGVSAYAFGGQMHTWINTSVGGVLSFGTDSTVTVPPDSFAVSAVDLDGSDALAVLAPGKLTMFLNATAPSSAVATFQSPITRDTGASPTQMFFADMDGDGSKEIGVLHYDGALWIYQNRGTGTDFEAARVLDSYPYAKQVLPFDLNGDARADLFMASSGFTSQKILTNTSQAQSFTFDAASAIISDTLTRRAASFQYPSRLLQVDLDGVAPSEIVVASSDGVRVLFGD